MERGSHQDLCSCPPHPSSLPGLATVEDFALGLARGLFPTPDSQTRFLCSSRAKDGFWGCCQHQGCMVGSVPSQMRTSAAGSSRVRRGLQARKRLAASMCRVDPIPTIGDFKSEYDVSPVFR